MLLRSKITWNMGHKRNLRVNHPLQGFVATAELRGKSSHYWDILCIIYDDQEDTSVGWAGKAKVTVA